MSRFKEILYKKLDETGLTLAAAAVDRLEIYYELLVDRNRVMNLTALTEAEDVALKHFCDSLTIFRYCDVPEGASVIDVGTGAGFPGMVMKIARPDIRLTLLDSLNKRLGFLDEVCGDIGFDDVVTIHSRAEDGARTELRDSFDIAVSRAVAELNTLCEYCLPYVKAGGRFISMKGKDARAELDNAANAIKELNGNVLAFHSFNLAEAGERAIIEIEKTAPTPDRYPRKSKAIKTKPL